MKEMNNKIKSITQIRKSDYFYLFAKQIIFTFLSNFSFTENDKNIEVTFSCADAFLSNISLMQLMFVLHLNLFPKLVCLMIKSLISLINKCGVNR